MDISVLYVDDAASVLAMAGKFLLAEPVLHNLILSLLEVRVKHPEPGRYWVAMRSEQVAGVVFQSPLNFFANLSRIEDEAIAALVEAIRAAGVKLPGVNGEARVAARFAGEWAEQTKSGATPQQGMRLYELRGLRETPKVEGVLRQATLADRDLLIEWQLGFYMTVREPLPDVPRHVE